MKRIDSRVYSINDFKEWDEAGVLVLAPKFQRRLVWSDKARSYLVDTTLRDLPIPKIFMRQRIDDTGRTIREIVDGQQRLRTIFGYLRGGFPVMPVHGKGEFGGKYYGDLPKDLQKDFLNYSISVDILIGASDVEILDIFARLNTYGVRLNRQELINAKYFGDFKSTVYELGHGFHRFWLDNGVLSEYDIARMLDAEMTSELIIAMLSGIQSRKAEAIDKYYVTYDDLFEEKPLVVERFTHCMDLIGEIMDGRLPTSSFSSRHLFYSLFCAVFDLLCGFPESSIKRVEFNETTIQRVRSVLTSIDAVYAQAKEKEYDVSKDDRGFIDATTKHTTDLSARQIRHKYIVGQILRAL